MRQRYRRASTLVFYWEDGQLVCEDYVTHAKAAVGPGVMEFLSRFDRPIAWETLRKENGYGRLEKAALKGLLRVGFIRKGQSEVERELDSWWWGKAAQHFLFSTKDAHKPAPKARRRAYARKLHQIASSPPLYKTYAKTPTVKKSMQPGAIQPDITDQYCEAVVRAFPAQLLFQFDPFRLAF